MFPEALPRAEARAALRRQADQLGREIATWEGARPLKGPLTAAERALYDNGLDHLRADLTLVRRLLGVP